MADIEDVRAAVDDVVERMADLEPDTRRRIPDRTVAVWMRDLDVAFAGRFDAGHLLDVTEIDPADFPAASLRITLTSEDFLDLVEGRLGFGHGWARGRIKVDAHFRDLFELRRFL